VKNVLTRAHKKFEHVQHTEIHLFVLNAQHKAKIKLRLDLVGKPVHLNLCISTETESLHLYLHVINIVFVLYNVRRKYSKEGTLGSKREEPGYEHGYQHGYRLSILVILNETRRGILFYAM
jgi:hypothetical protein